MVEFLNLLTFCGGAILFLILLFHLIMNSKKSLVNPVSRIILFYVISDLIDVTCTLLFATNSALRSLSGHDVSMWNTLDPFLAMTWRWMIFGSSIFAYYYSSWVETGWNDAINKVVTDARNVSKHLEDI